MPTLTNHAFARTSQKFLQVRSVTPRAIASAYNHVGDGYGRYADGERLDDPSTGENRFAHADTIVWDTIRKTIEELRTRPLASISPEAS
jgi:hypothetical protein